jgi:hypothetical protein
MKARFSAHPSSDPEPIQPSQDEVLGMMVRDFTQVGLGPTKSEVRRRILDFAKAYKPEPEPPSEGVRHYFERKGMTRFQKKAFKLRVDFIIKHRIPGLSWLSQSAVAYLRKGCVFVVDYERPIVAKGISHVPEWVRTYGIFDTRGNRIRGFGRVTLEALRDARLVQAPRVSKFAGEKPPAKVYRLIGNSSIASIMGYE